MLTYFAAGGMRNERKKWQHLFKEVKYQGIIYLLFASEYQYTCYEDATTNRLEESIKLLVELEDYCPAGYPFFVIINGVDTFIKDFYARPHKISSFFPKYNGPNEPFEYLKFLRSLILSQLRPTTKMEVYFTEIINVERTKQLWNYMYDKMVLAEKPRMLYSDDTLYFCDSYGEWKQSKAFKFDQSVKQAYCDVAIDFYK